MIKRQNTKAFCFLVIFVARKPLLDCAMVSLLLACRDIGSEVFEWPEAVASPASTAARLLWFGLLSPEC